VTIAAAIAAFQLTWSDMDYYYAFAGDMAQGRTPASSTAELREGLYHTESGSGMLATFAASLFSHNARIGILAFATGFVAGLPTLFCCSTTASCSARSPRCSTRAASASICGR